MPVIGGLQSATFEIGKYFRYRDWNVKVITNRYPRNLTSYESIDGLDIKRYAFLTDPMKYINAGRVDLFISWFFYKPVTLTKLIIDFIRFKPKVVNLHFPDHQLFECYLLMHLFHFKLVISLHGDEVVRMQRLKKSLPQF